MKFGLLLTVVVVAIWFIFGAMVFRLFGWEGQGSFGDTFGVLNVLFSGLAMVGLIVAIIMQKEELALQRKELQLTREELTRSVEVQKVSGEALHKQVEMLQLTARINAYSVLEDLEVGRLLRGLSGEAATTAQLEIDRYASKLRDVLGQVEKVG